MVLHDAAPHATVITLLPNQSAGWPETRLFLLLICGTTLAVGMLWAVAGLWAVLPFSGLEAALVGWLLYRVCQASYQRQVITCTADSVIVQYGTHFPKRSWTLDRSRTRIRIAPVNHPLDAPALHIVDLEHSIELGRFLNRDDKALALQALKDAGLPARSAGDAGHRTL